MTALKVLGKNSETRGVSERRFQLLMFSGTPSKIIFSEVLAWLSDSVKSTAGSSTTSDSEVDASSDAVVLSDTSDKATETDILAASEIKILIESDTTEP